MTTGCLTGRKQSKMGKKSLLVNSTVLPGPDFVVCSFTSDPPEILTPLSTLTPYKYRGAEKTYISSSKNKIIVCRDVISLRGKVINMTAILSLRKLQMLVSWAKTDCRRNTVEQSASVKRNGRTTFRVRTCLQSHHGFPTWNVVCPLPPCTGCRLICWVAPTICFSFVIAFAVVTCS